MTIDSTARILLAIIVFFLPTVTAVFANKHGNGISREQAIAIAKQELMKAGSDPARFGIYVDEGNKLWRD